MKILIFIIKIIDGVGKLPILAKEVNPHKDYYLFSLNQ